MKNGKTVVITGANGMLGEAVYAQFSKDWNVRAADVKLDVTKNLSVERFIKKVKPDAIVHLAALTDLEYCELHPSEAYDVNALGVANVLAPAIELGIPFVHISTARIFNGKRRSYSEYDTADPIGIYGKSKYAGEIIARAYAKSIIIRGGWMVGGGPQKDKKFVNKIIQRINDKEKELQIIDNTRGTISYTYDVARTIQYLLERRAYGIYHCVCDDETSRFEITKFIVRELGLENKIKISKVNSSRWSKEYFSPRPGSESLINSILKKMNPDLTRPWRVCLADYLKRFDWLRLVRK